jgi:glycosyltransferase involved in cell wall biosynthesis
VRPRRIDQALHILAFNDAIGTHVLFTRDVLRAAGFESDIYAGEVHPELKSEALPIEDLPLTTGPGSWLLFHHSIGSSAAEAVLKRRAPLLIDYHNITPAPLVDRWAPWVREELELGIDQLQLLALKAFFGVAHSFFTERELHAVGCERTAVVPPLFSLEGRSPDGRSPARHSAPADGVALAALRNEKADGGADWLFVGRISPHKAQHDIVKALVCARDLYDPKARLHLVGTSLGDDYPRALERFATRLGIAGAVRMPGMVPSAVLSAYYETADVFVCLSDHEGFCVPVVEAMQRGVPVVAFDAAAVGETVGNGGIVLPEKSPVTVAAAAKRVVSDHELAKKMIELGHARAAEMAMPTSGDLMIAAIERAIKVAEQEGIA